MALIWPWLLPVWAAALLAAGLIAWRRTPRPKQAAPVAHSDRLRTLPSFARRRRLYGALLALDVTLIAAGLAAAALASARPVVAGSVPTADSTRDTMICLDVSGSMWEADRDLLAEFAQLGADDYAGQRVGLMAFDAAPVTVFPLTDDYLVVQETIVAAQAALAFQTAGTGQASSEVAAAWETLTAGTDAGGMSSAVGDGLASCVAHLGEPDPPRTQSIVFVTDNFHGAQVYTVAEAAQLAAGRGIRVYVLAVRALGGTGLDELEAAAAATGGRYYAAGETDPAEVVADISRLEALAGEGAPLGYAIDRPGWLLAALWLAGAGAIIVAWRLRR